MIIALVVFGLGRSTKETKPETKTETTEQKEPEKKEEPEKTDPDMEPLFGQEDKIEEAATP